MPRTKLSERTLPDYTRGEEIFNTVSHIAGGAVGLAALVACVFPFIPFDILKIALATAVGYPVRHRLARRGLL